MGVDVIYNIPAKPKWEVKTRDMHPSFKSSQVLVSYPSFDGSSLFPDQKLTFLGEIKLRSASKEAFFAIEASQ